MIRVNLLIASLDTDAIDVVAHGERELLVSMPDCGERRTDECAGRAAASSRRTDRVHRH